MNGVIFVKRYFWKEHVLVFDRIGGGNNLSSKLRKNGIKVLVCGFPMVDKTTGIYCIPLLIDRKDHDKVEKIVKEHKKKFMYDNTISDYESFSGIVRGVVNKLRNEYNGLSAIAKAVENVILSVHLLKDIIQSNYALAFKV